MPGRPDVDPKGGGPQGDPRSGDGGPGPALDAGQDLRQEGEG